MKLTLNITSISESTNPKEYIVNFVMQGTTTANIGQLWSPTKFHNELMKEAGEFLMIRSGLENQYKEIE